jgi:hypothetical protein
MLPFEQGGLDALCGVYSIVNAERLINNTTSEDSNKLFDTIVEYLDERGLLCEMLTSGMRLKQIKMILDKVLGTRIPYRSLPFQGVATPGLSAFWAAVHSFLSEGPRRAVLLGMAGVYDHWTVIKSISSRQIQLFDSYRIHCLNRANCTTGNSKGARHHVLFPAQTYFLGVL